MKIYAGLTLSADEVARRLPDAVVAPPIRRGDLAQDIAAGVDAVGMIDGVFHHSAAVSPAEVLDALRAGISVWGASSMGALRAAELSRYGMRGVGRVFELIASTPDFRDDFVGQAVIEGPDGLVDGSQAWVDLYFRLEGEAPAVAAEVMRLYASIDYPRRTLQALLALCSTPEQRLAASIGARRGPGQKHLDALALLEAMAAYRASIGVRQARPRASRVVDPGTYLADFHDDHPGATARSLGRGRLADGRPSYALCMGIDARSVLDLGCGDGVLLAALDDGQRRLVGLDVSSAELGRARARAPRAELLEARGDAIPLPDGAVDAVVSHFALMLATPIDATIREIARVVAPGGSVVAVVPAARAPEGFLAEMGATLRGMLASARVSLSLGDVSGSPEAIARAMTAAGLTSVTVEHHWLVLDAPIEALIAMIREMYGTDLITSAQRAELSATLRERYADLPLVPCRVPLACVTARRP